MKTKSPIWDKTFHFEINDAFSVLKISVASEKMNSPLVRPSTLNLSTVTKTNSKSKGNGIGRSDIAAL